MDPIYDTLINSGVIGAFAAALLWQNNQINRRMMDIIEKNTQALVQLKAMIEKCQVIHNK